MPKQVSKAELFSELLQKHGGIVRKVAATYCRHPEDRADLMQEIITQLWQSWSSFDDARIFSTWMYRVALNVAISQVRRQHYRNAHSLPLDEAVHDVAAPRIEHETEQQIRMLQSIIEQLDDLNKALLMLYLDDRSLREIAEVLGISESNVGTKLARLKQRIRAEFN